MMQPAELSLPEIQAHLLQLGQFLVHWKWLALTRPTHILVDSILESNEEIICQASSLTIEEHLAILSGNQVTLPPLVKDFVETIAQIELAVFSDGILEEFETQTAPQKKTSAKKHHETVRLSKIVSTICALKSVQCIVDIGSGLGYVDRELCNLVDCDVLAVESEEARCISADAANKMAGLGERITQLPLKLQGSNLGEVVDVLSQTMKRAGCLIALHACGDLTPTALRLFERMPLIESAVILSCCYHKMSANEPAGFHNFPMSDFLKAHFSSGSVDPALADVSFLRLAAESTKEMWAARGVQQLSLHARSVAFRALVVSYENNKGIKFSKRVRKPAKASSRNSWTGYVAAWVENTDAVRLCDGEIVEKVVVKADLERIGSETDIEDLVAKTLAFNTMKSCIQRLTELFVLNDRLLALAEAGFPKCKLVRVSDPSISPRCIAVVVNR